MNEMGYREYVSDKRKSISKDLVFKGLSHEDVVDHLKSSSEIQILGNPPSSATQLTGRDTEYYRPIVFIVGHHKIRIIAKRYYIDNAVGLVKKVFKRIGVDLQEKHLQQRSPLAKAS